MEYKKAREILKTWDIILYNNNTIFWRIIRFVTGEKATHAAVAVWWGERLKIVESLEWKGVIDEYASTRLLRWNIVKVRRRRINITERTVIERALKKVGTRYDWYINFWLFLKKVFKIKVQINHEKRYNCSEFAAYVNNLENLYVSPWDLLKSKELKNVTK